jgi:hypothetical protein
MSSVISKRKFTPRARWNRNNPFQEDIRGFGKGTTKRGEINPDKIPVNRRERRALAAVKRSKDNGKMEGDTVGKS